MTRRSVLAALAAAGVLAPAVVAAAPPTSARGAAAASEVENSGASTRDSRAGEKIGKRLRVLAEAGMPLTEQRAFLTAKLRGRGISRRTVKALLSHAVDGITLRPTDQVGLSHLGGQALVLPGETWPTNRRSGRKLRSVAVLDLAELRAAPPLPPDGCLVFYYDAAGVEDGDASDTWLDIAANAAVRWIPPGAPASEVAPPEKVLSYPRQSVTGTAMPIIGGIPDDFGAGSARHTDQALDTYFGLASTAYGVDQLLGASQDLQGPVLAARRFDRVVSILQF